MEVVEEGVAVATVALDRAVEAIDIVTGLKAYGLTQADIARALGVSDRAVRGWRQHGITNARYEVLADLRDVVVLLSDSLTPRGVGQWFHARNRLLDGSRPLDAFAHGHADQVLAAARAFDEGAYV